MKNLKEQGFTLLELMVALVVTLVITGSMWGLMASSQGSFRREPALMDRQQQIRIAMTRIRRDFVPLWNDEKYDGHLWIYRDITESKKAESQLKIQEEKYRSIVEKATDIMYKVNAEGYFTFVNDVAEHITGYSKEELLKMRYSQLIRNDFKKEAFEIYRNQIENKTPSTYIEFSLVTKYGKEIWMGQSVQYPKTKDASSQLTALAIDIDKRKHAELNLKLQRKNIATL